MKQLFRIIDTATEYASSVFTLCMCAAIFIQVIFRYFLNNALSWPEEMGRYMFLWGTYLAISLAMAGNGHLRITVLFEVVPAGVVKCLNIFSMVVCACFFLLLTGLGVDMTIRIYGLDQHAISMPLPIYLVWAGIPICCFLTFLQSLRNIWRLITAPKQTAEPPCGS